MVLCVSLFLVSTAANAEETIVASGTCGDNLTWVLTEDGTLTISGTGNMYDYNSDLYPDGAVPWADCIHKITSVSIESGVTSIGDWAFSDCWALTEVTISEGVASIGDSAFYSCESLTEITIPGSVTSIGDSAFIDCSSLEEVTIPGSVSSIGDSAFHYCSSLAEITFHGNAPAFGDNPFEGVTATAYYPEGNPTWTDDVMQNYGGNLTWVAYDPVLPGDVNGDGGIDTTDAYLIVMYYNEKMDLDDTQLSAADVDGNDKVDTTDAYYIVMYYNEMIDTFPAAQ